MQHLAQLPESSHHCWVFVRAGCTTAAAVTVAVDRTNEPVGSGCLPACGTGQVPTPLSVTTEDAWAATECRSGRQPAARAHEPGIGGGVGIPGLAGVVGRAPATVVGCKAPVAVDQAPQVHTAVGIGCECPQHHWVQGVPTHIWRPVVPEPATVAAAHAADDGTVIRSAFEAEAGDSREAKILGHF